LQSGPHNCLSKDEHRIEKEGRKGEAQQSLLSEMTGFIMMWHVANLNLLGVCIPNHQQQYTATHTFLTGASFTDNLSTEE